MIVCLLFITEAVLGHVEIMLQSRCWKKIKKTIHASLTDLLDFFFQTNKTTALMKRKKRTLVSVKIPISPTHTLHFCVNMFSTFFK